jgi:alkanesulfonate monooxygenase SsuD/methylene tetrahydromethanopterin reductase-like flavin-dependent oxidoreductase (luciferase family)
MRFGTFNLIGAPNMESGEQRVNDTLAQIVLADELGFHVANIAEHHFSNYGYAVNPLLIIARAAGVTRRIRFGQAVIVTPFWQPIRLAEDIALTDILTGGRLEIGLGRGYQKMEFDSLGLDMDAGRPLFLEQLEVMKKAWTEDDFTHDGQFYKIERPTTVLPRPAQKPHPQIWIACQSDSTVDWTADQGYYPLFSGGSATPAQIVSQRDRFVNRWRAAGHANQNPKTAIQRFVYVTDTDDEAREAIWQTRWQRRLAYHLRNNDARITAGRNEPYPAPNEAPDDEWWDRLIYGTPERCIAQIKRDADLGFSECICWFDIGGLPQATVERSMRKFASEVMPAFAEVGAGAVAAG